MFRMTETELEVISDIDMYLFVEKWLRGGTSYIAKRFSKTNINACNLIMIKYKVNTLNILKHMISMIGQWVKI